MATPAAAAAAECAVRDGTAVPPPQRGAHAALPALPRIHQPLRFRLPRVHRPLRLHLHRHLTGPLRAALPWLLAAFAVALDAASPAAQLYLARCGAAPFSFGNLVAHLAAFPCSSAAMLLLCFTALPCFAPRAAMLRFTLMAATMPAVCLAAPLLSFLSPVPQALAYGAAMFLLPLLAERSLPDTHP